MIVQPVTIRTQIELINNILTTGRHPKSVKDTFAGIRFCSRPM